MIGPSVLTVVLAAVPSVLARSNNTSYFTRCTTRFGFYPLPTGTAAGAVPTWYSFINSTNTFTVTTTARETFTVAPNVTVCGGGVTGVVTETSTVKTTSTFTPPAVTVSARTGQLPLIILNPTTLAVGPTAVPRIALRRIQAEPREVTHLINRQTSPGNTGGFIVNPDGSTSNLNRVFPHRVFCERRRTVDTTSTVTVIGAPTTAVLAPGTATAYSTTTITTTITIIETAPTPKVYAACGGNNVVDHITGTKGARINFNRVVYRPQEGFPIANELVVNTTSAVNCCGACQDTPNCAGSFFVPSQRGCHLRLIAPPSNATFPTLPSNSSGLIPSGTSPSAPVSTAVVEQCKRGSDTLWLGTIRGRSPAEFKDEFAVSFSNGPCGRFSVSPLPDRSIVNLGTKRTVKRVAGRIGGA